MLDRHILPVRPVVCVCVHTRFQASLPSVLPAARASVRFRRIASSSSSVVGREARRATSRASSFLPSVPCRVNAAMSRSWCRIHGSAADLAIDLSRPAGRAARLRIGTKGRQKRAGGNNVRSTTHEGAGPPPGWLRVDRFYPSPRGQPRTVAEGPAPRSQSRSAEATLREKSIVVPTNLSLLGCCHRSHASTSPHGKARGASESVGTDRHFDGRCRSHE